MSWDAVLLAGGRAQRLDGVDKPGLRLAGRSLLDRALSATAAARARVVVGPPRPVPAGVLTAREAPPFGGPVAALAAGLAALPGDALHVAVLAADLPAVEAALPLVLRAAGTSVADGCLAVDPGGRDQPLLAVYRAEPLRAAVGALAAERGTLEGAAIRMLMTSLRLDRVPLSAELCADVDDVHDAFRAGIPLPPRRHPGDLMTDQPVPASANDSPTPADLDRWVAHLAGELGVDPALVDVGAILDLARDAAHTVARPAAPLTAFVLGYAAARRGAGGATEVREIAARATEVVAAWRA